MNEKEKSTSGFQRPERMPTSKNIRAIRYLAHAGSCRITPRSATGSIPLARAISGYWVYPDAASRFWLHLLLPNCSPGESQCFTFSVKTGDENRNNPSSILRTMIFQLLGSSIHGPYFTNILYDELLKGIPVRDYSLLNLWTLMERMVDTI